jgi:hypothetical protein
MAVCVWVKSPKSGNYATTCGRYVLDDSGREGWVYCPWCGGKLKHVLSKGKPIRDELKGGE